MKQESATRDERRLSRSHVHERRCRRYYQAEATRCARQLLCFEPITKGDGFELHPDGIHDGYHRPRFEDECWQHRAELVNGQRVVAVEQHVPTPVADAYDEQLDLEIIRRVEQRIGFSLAESQMAAIRLALISKVLVITGGPGVGKTTIIRGILRILSAKGINLALCAPTGRAAKRMTEATGFEAKTIHRLLEVDPKSGGFKRGEDTCSIAICWSSTRRPWSMSC